MEEVKMNIIKLSFIVPVYNMEKYLVECVESILTQKVNESEIILVDDGSADNSAIICDKFAEEYSQISVIHKKNGGISSARNVGLKAARGTYVCFVDSDDFFKTEFAGDFLEVCDTHDVDIIRGWYGIYDEEQHTYLPHEFPDISFLNQVLTGREFLIQTIVEQANEVVPWLGFFRREYLLKNKLIFPEGISYEEDQLFFLDALLCDANCRVWQSDCEFYAYRKRVGSATKTPTLKQVRDIIYVVTQENMLIDRYCLSAQESKAAKKYICSSFYQLTSIYGHLNKKDRRETVKLVPFHMEWMCMCNPYNKHQQIKIFLFTFARWVVDIVYLWRRK